MAPVLADPAMHEYLNGGPLSEAELRRRYEFMEGGRTRDDRYGSLTWNLFLKSNADAIGFVEATIDEPDLFYIAYALNPRYWRQGFAGEACDALLELLFDVFDVPKAVVEMDVSNTTSIALAESLGFAHVKTVEDPARRRSEHVYELTRRNWRRARS